MAEAVILTNALLSIPHSRTNLRITGPSCHATFHMAILKTPDEIPRGTSLAFGT